jgi:hypothetical protein
MSQMAIYGTPSGKFTALLLTLVKVDFSFFVLAIYASRWRWL